MELVPRRLRARHRLRPRAKKTILLDRARERATWDGWLGRRVRRTPRAAFLPVLPVVLLHREGLQVDIVEAAGVDGDGVGAVGGLAASEGLDAAGLAEQVVDDVVVELVARDGVSAGLEGETIGGDERE